MKRILFLSNIEIELKNPYFRLGAYKSYLIPLSKCFSGGDYEVSFMLNDFVYSKLLYERQLTRDDRCFVFNFADLVAQRLTDFITKSYSTPDDESCRRGAELIKAGLGGYEPDIIIIWETPSAVFRRLFPRALVLDLMPGFLNRPPYPKMISIDPCGIYRRCWYASLKGFMPDKDLTASLERLRSYYLGLFNEFNIKESFENLLNVDFKNSALVPLQISDYFGFKDNCAYQNQLEFLIDTVSPNTSSSYIVTQYVSFVEDRAVNQEDEAYLTSAFPQIKFSEALNKIDSISQFILPFTDRIYSVSSTLGLQGAFLGKELVSNSSSHLHCLLEHREQMQDILAALLLRGSIFYSRIDEDKDYIRTLVEEMLQKFKLNHYQADASVLPDAQTADNRIEEFIKRSNISAALRNIARIFPDASILQLPKNISASITTPNVDVISFDLFDTLVERRVYSYYDVFLIMQERLLADSGSGRLFPAERQHHFAELRYAAERVLRTQYDRRHSGREEFTIEDIYAAAEKLIGSSIDKAGLIELEQEIELELLQLKKFGRKTYLLAKLCGKRVILTSDFTHGRNFIDKLLHKFGYDGFDAVYLSSEVGLKKQTSSLFKYILDKEQTAPDRIIHLGDNPIGDVSNPRSLGMRALLVPSAFSLFKDGLKELGLSAEVLKHSLFLRETVSQYCSRNFDAFFALKCERKKVQRQELDLKDLGFLTLGPIFTQYAYWILNKAKAAGFSQVVFFARDSYLPYEICRQLAPEICPQLKLVYLPVSRRLLTGCNILSRQDLLNIRVDDFSRNLTLADLLLKRFLVTPEDAASFDSAALAEYGLADLNVPLKELDANIINPCVYTLLRDNFDLIKSKYEHKRALIAALLSQCGADCTVPTFSVDFGYKGSIHQMLRPFFSAAFEPLMFMSYSNGCGAEPVEDAAAFYRSRLNPAVRNDRFLSHNMLLETIVNQNVGTAAALEPAPDHSIAVSKENISSRHAEIIAQLHAGALAFGREIADHVGRTHCFHQLESNELELLIDILIKHLDAQEISNFEGLQFDNVFSGIGTSEVFDPGDNFRVLSRIWPEAYTVYTLKQKQPAAPRQGSVLKAAAQTAKQKVMQSAAERSLPFYLLLPLVKATASEKKLRKYQRNPQLFFADSNSRVCRAVGRLLF